MTITENIRNNLEPKGTLQVCHLHMDDQFVDKEFVWRCIDELDRMFMRRAAGDRPTALEQLAYELLMQSAYLK